MALKSAYEDRPAAPREAGRLNIIIDALEAQVKHSAEQASELHNMADRLVGPVPQGVSAADKDPPSHCAADRLERLIEQLGGTLGYKSEAIGRLERL
jgi:hypothetical protein